MNPTKFFKIFVFPRLAHWNLRKRNLLQPMAEIRADENFNNCFNLQLPYYMYARCENTAQHPCREPFSQGHTPRMAVIATSCGRGPASEHTT